MPTIKMSTHIAAWTVVVLLLADQCRSTVVRAGRVKRIVGGVRAAVPPPDDPVVFVRLYGRNARVEGVRDSNSGLYEFRGIRFAEPPVGPNRFLRPRFRRLRGDVNATLAGPVCPQPGGRSTGDRILGDEDCLWLNVFTPRLPDDSGAGLPVLVFIHGGGFRFGSANQYGPDPLTSASVIFVPVQYRLGTLGLLGDGSAQFPGNVALFDMAAAVRWTHEYISFFGGDPQQISVIGHGSGATSAVQLSMSDAIESDMIAGVIAMSGSGHTQYTLDERPRESIGDIAAINGCPSKVGQDDAELLQCLRGVGVAELVRRDTRLQTQRLAGRAMLRSMTGMAGFAPVVERPFDDRSLPSFVDRPPSDKLARGLARKLPLLIGVTKHETGQAIELDDIQAIFETATKFLGAMSEDVLNASAAVLSRAGEKVDLLGVGKLLGLSDYLKIAQSIEPHRVVAKLVEVSTDALFNLPAVQSAQEWSKGAPAFLYSFEYVGNRAKGSTFLAGLPIVAVNGNGRENGVECIAHGDELAYLFDVRDLNGNPVVDEITNATDAKVRSDFVDLIADFLRSIAHLRNVSSEPPSAMFGQRATSSSMSFIRIGQTIDLASDFRHCQLSLWGVDAKAENTDSCAFLVDQLAEFNSLAGNVAGVLENGFPPVPLDASHLPAPLPPPVLPAIAPPKPPNPLSLWGGKI